MNVIIVTACPSGMATSFLAARRLEQAARRRDWEPLIDMRSQFERELVLSDAQLAAAELVIVAASPMTSAGLERFVGKRVHVAPIEEALPDPAAFLANAESRARVLEAKDTLVVCYAKGILKLKAWSEKTQFIDIINQAHGFTW